MDSRDEANAETLNSGSEQWRPDVRHQIDDRGRPGAFQKAKKGITGPEKIGYGSRRGRMGEGGQLQEVGYVSLNSFDHLILFRENEGCRLCLEAPEGPSQFERVAT